MTPAKKTRTFISFDDPTDWPSLHSGQFANLVYRSPEIQIWRSRMTVADGERERIHIEFLERGRWVDIKESERFRYDRDLARALEKGTPCWFAEVVLPDSLRVELGYPETAELVFRYCLHNERPSR